jgi:hypothetical protein
MKTDEIMDHYANEVKQLFTQINNIFVNYIEQKIDEKKIKKSNLLAIISTVIQSLLFNYCSFIDHNSDFSREKILDDMVEVVKKQFEKLKLNTEH